MACAIRSISAAGLFKVLSVGLVKFKCTESYDHGHEITVEIMEQILNLWP